MIKITPTDEILLCETWCIGPYVGISLFHDKIHDVCSNIKLPDSLDLGEELAATVSKALVIRAVAEFHRRLKYADG